jgi:hypothetical protein
MSISVEDCLNLEDLRCQYSSPPSARMALAAAREQTTLTPEPKTVKVQVPAEVSPPAVQAAAPRARGGPTYVLHIDGIQVPPDRSAVVRVFVNDPKADARTKVEDPHYVGYFTVVASSGLMTAHAARHRPHHAVFDVTDKVGSVIKDPKDLTVTLVPVAAKDEKPESIDLTFRNVYLTVEP